MLRFKGRIGITAATILLGGLIALVAANPTVAGVAPPTDSLGISTLDQRVVGDGADGYNQLVYGPGEGYVVREEGVGTAGPGREGKRESIAYIGQLSDFQLADEESPARVELVDVPLSSAWRPWEAMNPHIDDSMIRQINAFAPASPVLAGDGSARPMDFTVITGDNADNQHFNETDWTRILLDGGELDPNSGIDPTGYIHPLCPPVGVPGAAEAAGYTGVQDYDDYVEDPSPYFYDPEDPRGTHVGFPSYPNLMDEAQKPFVAAGIDVPTYLAVGNHDGLAQGNQAANAAFEGVSTGCIKPFVGNPSSLSEAFGLLDPTTLTNLLANDPTRVGLVPPDPDRRYVSKQEYKDVFRGGAQADGYGFGLTDPTEEAASNNNIAYYAFSPIPGVRLISIDTVSEGGIAGPSANGNIDDPQFKWIESEMAEATAADELIVVFSHHAISSLNSPVSDEMAPPCTATDAHGHDVNPGCDVDPRDSTPIHDGADMTALMHKYPNMVAWIAGHSHSNNVEPFPNPSGTGGFWSIRTAAETDWPNNTRLVEIFDNKDGTLSIFGTIIDLAAPATAQAGGLDTTGLSVDELASIGRTLSYNDLQSGSPSGEGGPEDRNVELLVADPLKGGGGDPDPEPGRCSNLIDGTNGSDRLIGTGESDRMRGRDGDDRLSGARAVGLPLRRQRC